MAATVARASASSAKTSAKSKGSPVLSFAVGIFMLFWFTVATLLHIWTSEAFFLPPHSISFFPNSSIFLQIWHLVHGEYSVRMAQAVVWGNIIEVIVLGCVAGYDIAHYSVKHSNPQLAKIAIIGMVVAIGFDGWTDYQFMAGVDGMIGAMAWATAICFVVFFFGTLGFGYLMHGIEGLRA